MSDRLTELKDAANRALARARSREAGLWYDGSPRFDEGQHMRRLGEIRSELHSELTRISREAAEIEREAKQRVEDLRLDKPGVLSYNDRLEVSSRLGLQRAELARLGMTEITARVHAAIERGSRPEMFALWTVLGEKIDALGDAGPGATAMLEVAYRDLDVALFSKAWENAVAADVAEANRAMELGKFCRTREVGATTLADAYINRTRPSVRQLIDRQRYHGKPPTPSEGGGQPTGEVANG